MFRDPDGRDTEANLSTLANLNIILQFFHRSFPSCEIAKVIPTTSYEYFYEFIDYVL